MTDQLDPAIAARLRRNEVGLFPVVVHEHSTGTVLMLAWMDDEALRRTLTTGRATYWSRSREQYWVKGETSGHDQHVLAAALDCDGDALLLTVRQVGPACHTGSHSCFANPLPVAGQPSPMICQSGTTHQSGTCRSGTTHQSGTCQNGTNCQNGDVDR